MAAPMMDNDAAGLIVTYLKSSGQICWYNLAYLKRLIGTGAVLQGVSLNWPKNKVCSSAFAHSPRAQHAFKGLKGGLLSKVEFLLIPSARKADMPHRAM